MEKHWHDLKYLAPLTADRLAQIIMWKYIDITLSREESSYFHAAISSTLGIAVLFVSLKMTLQAEICSSYNLIQFNWMVFVNVQA
jgi:uncharacterized membrane protein